MSKVRASYSQPMDTDQLSVTSRVPAHRKRSFQIPVSERRIMLIAGDLLAIELAVLGSLALWARDGHYAFDTKFILSETGWFFVLPALWLMLATVNDYYNLRVAARVGASLSRLALIVGEVMVVYLATFFLSPPGTLPRLFIAFYAVISLALIGLWRAARIFLIGWQGFQRRALVVGTGHEAEVMWRALKDEAAGDYEVVGMCASEFELAKMDHSLPYIGVASELPRLVATLGVTELVVTYSSDIPPDVFKNLLTCYERGAQVTPMARLYEQVTGRIPVEHIGEQFWSQALRDESHSFGLRLYTAWKRIADVVFALIGLLFFIPILPFLALAILFESRGPVFYKQTRVGKGGAHFQIYKLRTMRNDAENGTGAQWATKNDSRITRMGKFLRKTRLDELPQLFNMLRGDMSLIGPRPERPEFVDQLSEDIPYYRARLAVKPGLTGWAQVRFRYGNTSEDALRKLQYDLYYIRHQSLLLDIVIAFKTIGVMVTFAGM